MLAFYYSENTGKNLLSPLSGFVNCDEILGSNSPSGHVATIIFQNEASGQHATAWCSILTLEPCCSFARHVVGKMEIHSLFAHHYAQPRYV